MFKVSCHSLLLFAIIILIKSSVNMSFRLLTKSSSTVSSAALRRSVQVPLHASVFHKYQGRHNLQAQFCLSTNGGLQWPVDKVRSQFVDYFSQKHAHVNYKSSPCVPVNDPTLLFANAGMNQFKPIFIGTVDPSSPLANLKRAVNTQKCIRAGGKHNDLDDVGKDTYHHTFFEMLGTWSFGDYFKKEAIEWAYDILVNTYKLDPNRLYASYFAGDPALGLPCDEEAKQKWLEFLPPDRVLPFDKKANFWEMGDTGPCGPCTEIHYDRIGGRDAAALVNADDPDVIEIWNLVFIQFNRELDGSLRSLPSKHIDTGMGLERLTSILQDVRSNYDTDVFQPLFNAIQKEIGCKPYTGKVGQADAEQNYRDTAYRVIADHLRTLTFAITDGAVPSNEGRGYVLRRILRRAVRYGMQTLGAKPGFFSTTIPQVANNFGSAFPELLEKNADVVKVVREEEMAFAALLEKGVKYFNEVMAEQKGKSTVIDGQKAFYLYDTLGFPVDLTQIMAAENGFTVDLAGFTKAMDEQKERGRVATKSKRLSGRTALSLAAEQIDLLHKADIAVTNDAHKYQWDKNVQTKLKAIYAADGFVDAVDFHQEDHSVDSFGLILESSPFYAEAGGQVADSGRIVVNNHGQQITLDVIDVQSYGGYVLHTCVLAEDSPKAVVSKNSIISAEVDYERRRKIAPNHSMTHVLNCALRKVLGGNVDQKGSLVSDEKLRFDFSFNRAMTVEELQQAESLVNDSIQNELPVHNEVVPLQDALAIHGLRAVFGEVYPDPVRVLSVGPTVKELLNNPKQAGWHDFSVEFCGGTHIANTAEAKAFVILEETAVAKGIRRLTAVAGEEAIAILERSTQLLKEVEAVTNKLSNNTANVEAEELSRLDAVVVTYRNMLSSESISQVAQIKIRGMLEAAQKQIILLQHKEMMKLVDGKLNSLKQEVQQVVARGDKFAVFNIEIGSDAKAIKRATDEIKKIAPHLSFLCISPEADKITVFASVTEEQQKIGLKANEWISAAVKASGGRGGGKASLAQGSVNDASRLAQIIEDSQLFLSKM